MRIGKLIFIMKMPALKLILLIAAIISFRAFESLDPRMLKTHSNSHKLHIYRRQWLS
jgi:hypothetical protein